MNSEKILKISATEKVGVEIEEGSQPLPHYALFMM
jgi:hypothetical protein